MDKIQFMTTSVVNSFKKDWHPDYTVFICVSNDVEKRKPLRKNKFFVHDLTRVYKV